MHSNVKTPVTLRDYKQGVCVLYARGHWPIKGRYFYQVGDTMFSLYIPVSSTTNFDYDEITDIFLKHVILH